MNHDRSAHFFSDSTVRSLVKENVHMTLLQPWNSHPYHIQDIHTCTYKYHCMYMSYLTTRSPWMRFRRFTYNHLKAKVKYLS